MKVKLLKKLRKEAKQHVKMLQFKYSSDLKGYIIRLNDGNHYRFLKCLKSGKYYTKGSSNIIRQIEMDEITTFKNILQAKQELIECRRYYILNKLKRYWKFNFHVMDF
jgi:hypothetical protein